ncbi:hypothetical protein DUNSADRAFT_6659 [Dunaliella salina]|uniref:Encoded protein n=1 Tax=Dunaliella salina TaxID=3046 RepID=A0ABQ7GMW2_DUNSA|nr:hypothetical protein DUNSADRAFT_6659 [Dunaliella salina]|eukprot:KAF5835948.1 hypothetical protein DUNSADRAFT_6659 [Dunaliella salina]
MSSAKDDEAAEAAALDRILDELPALDGPWHCCISTSLPPSSPPRTPTATPASNSASPKSSPVHADARAAAPITITATTARAGRAPGPFSPSSSSSSTANPLAQPCTPSLLAGKPTAAISALQAKLQAAREKDDRVLRRTCTASRVQAQHQLQSAPAHWPLARACAGTSLSCRSLPARSGSPAAERLPQCISAPCIPHHMYAQRKMSSSPIAGHHALHS